jgi:hypothetical protein
MPEMAAGKQKIESLFPIPRHLDRATGIQLAQGTQGKLHFEGVVLDEKDVNRAG